MVSKPFFHPMEEVHMKYRIVELENEVFRLNALLAGADLTKLKLRNVIANMSDKNNSKNLFIEKIGEEHRIIANLERENRELERKLKMISYCYPGDWATLKTGEYVQVVGWNSDGTFEVKQSVDTPSFAVGLNDITKCGSNNHYKLGDKIRFRNLYQSHIYEATIQCRVENTAVVVKCDDLGGYEFLHRTDRIVPDGVYTHPIPSEIIDRSKKEKRVIEPRCREQPERRCKRQRLN